MNFLSTTLCLVLSFTLQDPLSCFAAGQTCGEDDKCGNCKKTNCPDRKDRRRCKRDHCSLEELAAFFPGDLMEPNDNPELSALGLFHKVQKGSEVKKPHVSAVALKKKKKKGGKKGRGPDSLALGQASIAGNTYGTVFLLGANEGCFFGVLTYDEKGSIVAGEGRGNLPMPLPNGQITFPLGVEGTVDELDAQGTGLQTINLETPFGITEDVPMNLEVTGVVGSKVETMRAAFEIPSPGVPGALVDASMTRRRADGYTDRSLRGLYAITCNSGLFTGFASGKLTSDGRGSLSGAMTFNDPDPENPIELRQIVTTDVTGSYEVEDNGLATVSLTFRSLPFIFIVTTNKDLIITRMAGASLVNGVLVACELDSLGAFFTEDYYETSMQ